MSLRVLVLLAIGLSASGCAGSGASTLPRPIETRVLLTTPRMESTAEFAPESVNHAARSGLEDDSTLAVDEADDVDAECLERASCLREVGGIRGVDFVATTEVITLGESAVVRAHLVAVGGSESDQVRLRLLSTSDPATIEASVRALFAELAAPFVPPSIDERALARRRRWRWLGPVLGVVAGAAATAIAVPLARREPDPDLVVVPP